MFGKLLPKETIFFDFFEKHATLMLEVAQTFLQFTLSAQGPNYQIKSLEHQADLVTSQCVEYLHKTFITPLQQDDILRLISRMDDVIDEIDEAFDHCLIYNITTFTPPCQELAQLLVFAVEKVDFSVKGLRNRKKHGDKIREAIVEIHRLENEADAVLRRAIGQLFQEEQDLRLLIKWRDIYETLEKAIDSCEDVSNIIQGIMLEYD